MSLSDLQAAFPVVFAPDMLANKRSPSNEPTLMIGDVPSNFDFTLVDDFVFKAYPRPIIYRKSTTKNKEKLNAFYQYSSFDEARLALKTLNGSRVPGMPYEYKIDMNFTKQETESCAHFSVCDVHFTRLEVMKLLTRYTSVLGLAQYKFQLWNGHTPKTTCFIRFGCQDECAQVVQELNGFQIENSYLHLSISTRFIDSLNDYVKMREAPKRKVGIPEFHNIYAKQIVSREKFNDIIITQSYDLFDDLEASRWSPVAFGGALYEEDYSRKMTLSRFEYL